MATYLRKAVCMGPAGTMTPSAAEPQDLRFNSRRYMAGGAAQPDNCFFFAVTGTKWARFFVHLPSLWPDRNTVRTDLLDNLDFQIAAARLFAGVQGVILSFHHDLPQWINGSANPRALPSDVSSGSNWALVVGQFAARYNRFNASRPYSGASLIDVLEPFNEPNLLAVQASSGGLNIGERVAVMMKTAKQIAGILNKTPIMAGPSVYDTDLTTANRTDYDLFTRQVLGGLANNGFYALRDSAGLPYDYAFVWTMHNYNDVERDHGPDTNTPDATTYYPRDPVRARTVIRTRRVAGLMSTRGWKGWPNGTPGYPGMFITEGGADVTRLQQNVYPGLSATDARTAQALLLQRSLQRLSNDDTGLGVGMMTNYLWYSGFAGSNGNTGVLDETNSAYAGGAVRPAATIWSQYPSRV